MKLFKLIFNGILIVAPLVIGIFYDWHLSDAIFSALVIFLVLCPIRSFIFFYATTGALIFSAPGYFIGQKEISYEIAVWFFYLFILTWAMSIWESVAENKKKENLK